ncbi:RTA1-domain-containing protein [Aureobasidium subglaciale]|nr:RTA1-domain-containing protein [Aureobasidium subglaciale]KAI5268888.1 RTA1-domain-containing protein [Aureobasidium subglaciale]
MALAPSNIDPDHLILYAYTPSSAAAGAFMGIFGVATIAHIFYLPKLRQCFFIPMILGGIMEVGGLYGRFWGHSDQDNFKAYVLQALLLTPAPIFLAATMYMTLGRVIVALDSDKDHTLIRPRWLSKVFVFFDIVCFVVQIGGIGMQCSISASAQKNGRTVTIIGLILQIFIFAYFIIVALVFHRRMNARPTAISVHHTIHWVRHLRVIYATSVLVTVRNIFRVAEYVEGVDGAIAHSEVYLYIFDSALMAGLTWAFVVVHPGRLLRAIKKLKNRRSAEMAEGEKLVARQDAYQQMDA